MKNFDIELVKSEVNKFLAFDGCYFANENIPKSEIISELFGILVLSENKILVCGFDVEEEMYYISTISGSLKKGYKFDYEPKWYEEKEDALEFMNSFDDKVKNLSN